LANAAPICRLGRMPSTSPPGSAWHQATRFPVGAFYRRLSARIGKAKAVTATARKIAGLFYNAVRHGMVYSDPGASYYEEQYKAGVLANLRRSATSLGFVLREAPSSA
jgi:hypothetical protein